MKHYSKYFFPGAAYEALPVMHFIVDCIDDITAADFPRSGYELSEDYSDGEIHICHPELPEEMTVVSETLFSTNHSYWKHQ